MNKLKWLVLFSGKALAVVVIGLFLFTQIAAFWIERQFPPVGQFMDVGGFKLHYVDLPAGIDAELPAMVFIHGASGNLLDQKNAFAEKLQGRGRMVFVDRPGHGYSERGGQQFKTPANQAKAISVLLKKLGIKKAVIIGHSFGGAVAAAFGVNHGDQLQGLVFVAPASHPWPGGIAWYYRLAARPVAGYVFTELLALPGGLAGFSSGIASVFAPNGVPENYAKDTAAKLVLRPKNFRWNAQDVAALKRNVRALALRYKEITAPTVIITGDSDDIVLAHIHSIGLQRDIAGAKLIELKKVGHKPDYVGGDVVIKAIETVAK